MNNKRLFLTFVLTFLCFEIFSAQKSYNILMNEGNQLFEKNKYEAAASKYLETVKQNKNDFAAHYNLANALYKSKKYEEAKAEYEKANQLSKTLSDKASALHNLGNTYMQMNQPEKAAEFYKQSLKQEPRNEATRKNYEIAKLKQKEKEQQQNQKNNKDGGGGKDGKNENKQGEGDQKKDSQQGGGQGNQQDNGQGQDGNNPNQNNKGNLPKGTQDAILNRISEREKETAKKILNKESYSMPESNEKDW